MSASYLPYHPTQAQLFPPSPLDWLPQDHLAYFVMDVVRELDLTALYRHAKRSAPKGELPFHPLLLANLLVYGYCVGETSSRGIARKTYDDVGGHVLAGGHHPDHVVLREFRRRNKNALVEVFTQVFAIAAKAGMTRLGNLVLSDKKTRGQSARARKLETERFQAIAQSLLDTATKTDKYEDRSYGKKNPGEALPDPLRDRKTRSALIQDWLAELAFNPKKRHRNKQTELAI